MRKLAATLAFAAAFVLVSAESAYGQSDQETVNVSVTIPQVLVLDVNTNSIPYGTINDNQVGTTITAGTNTVLSFRGNVPMSLAVASATNFFDAVDVANDNTKPSTDLAWSASAAGAVTLSNTSGTFSTASTSLFSGQARGAYVDEITVQYDLTVNWLDDPDTYDLDVVYTLSTP
jgi:hypothetical protein